MADIVSAKELGKHRRLKPNREAGRKRTELLKAHLQQLAADQGTTIGISGSSVAEPLETQPDTHVSSQISVESDPLLLTNAPRGLHNGIIGVAKILDEETTRQVNGLMTGRRVKGLSQNFDPAAEVDLEFGQDVIENGCFTPILQLSIGRMRVLRAETPLSVQDSEISALELRGLDIAA